MSTVLISTETKTRIINLNRPDKRNALNDELVADLKAALREADADESLRAIVIRGAGKDFCSGADLSALQKIATASYEENIEDARSLAELFGLIRNVRVPVIAAVRGRALAGGCGLAMACDFIVASDNAKFGFPEVKIGFVPAIVAAIVRRKMSESDAFTVLTLGYEMPALEMQGLNLVHAVFPDETFDSEALTFAKQYENLSGSAVAMTKRLLYDIDADTYQTAIEKGVVVNATARMTADCQNGIAKFLEK